MSDKYIVRSNRSPLDVLNISMSEFVWNNLQNLNPDNICIIDSTTKTNLTVKELITKSNALAMALVAKGVQKSDTIMTFAANSIEHMITLFAGAFLGTTLYPISPIANLYEMESLLETLGSMAIFTSAAKADIIDQVLAKNKKIKAKTVVVFDGVYNEFTTFADMLSKGNNQMLPKIPYFDVDPNKDIFIMLLSSGTTGAPKSLMTSHVAFNIQIRLLIPLKDLPNNRFAHITPFGCMSGSTFLFAFITSGVPIVIFREHFDELIIKAIDKYKVAIVFITPVFGTKLIDEQMNNKYDLSSLKLVFTAGAAFPSHVGHAIVEKHRLDFREAYGMTEFGPTTGWMHLEDGHYIAGSLGRPGRNTEMKIIDLNTGESLGPNMEGEICLRGPQMFSGYFNNPLATKETIDSEGWLRTGDIGYYDSEKRFFITDRLKELIKFITTAVSPTEIEQFLLTHKCVAEVAVVGVKHETQSQWVRAYVKVNDGMSITEEELTKFVADNLNDAKQLRAGVVFVDHIPRTTIGKVDRRYFKQLIADEVIKAV